MQTEGMLVIISGPSGSGKGTVVNELKKNDYYALSISLTTRKPRPGEIEGVSYFFCTVEEFERKRNNNELLEHASFVGNYYGTPRSYVEEQILLGKNVVLEIEVNGALQVKEKFPKSVLIFLIPPTCKELRHRLIKRNTEPSETIEDRMKRAGKEIEQVYKYDYLVVNDTVEKTVEDIHEIVKAERMKPFRCQSLIDQFKEGILD